MIRCLSINPRCVCAARVTVVGLRVSWGAIFSMRGGKGERKRGKEGREGGGKKGVKVQIEEGNSNFTRKGELVQEKN